MSPTDAAAAEPVSSVPGIDQKLGRYPCVPAAAIHSIATPSVTLSPAAKLKKNPTPATSIDPAVCQRRSPVRSDDHPTASSAARPTTYGSAAMKLTVRFDEPDIRFTYVGNQKTRPYTLA